MSTTLEIPRREMAVPTHYEIEMRAEDSWTPVGHKSEDLGDAEEWLGIYKDHRPDVGFRIIKVTTIQTRSPLRSLI